MQRSNWKYNQGLESKDLIISTNTTGEENTKTGRKRTTRLKSYLESHGISQTFLARKIGITQPWMNHIINGVEPKIGDALKICEVLDMPLEEIWEEYL